MKSEWTTNQRIRRAPVSRCVGCGLLATAHFLERQNDPTTLYDVGPQEHEAYRRHYLSARLAFHRRILPKLERFRNSGRLLEIGSGYGAFLEAAATAGWDAEGVEISRYACEVARGRGCKVHHCGELGAAPVAESAYDVIVMWDVIEHLTSPLEVLRRAASLLRPRGAIFVRTPDARALAPSLGPLRFVYRHFVYPANTPEHVFHFTPAAFARVLANVRIQQVEVDAHTVLDECVAAGNHLPIRVVRGAMLRYAHARGWPYEFVSTGVKT
jgi:2-polyprenyl-3-methyl-5-hydroxy-6-metoxy-1,4-benzoquinol methylase